MSRLITLVDKEWRDARAIVWGAYALVPLLTVGINQWFFHWQEGEFTGAGLVPAFVALFLAVIAADLVSQESTTGRARTFAALPAHARSLWLAKVAFLAGATLLFAVWTLLVQLVLHCFLADARTQGVLIESLEKTLPVLPVLLAVGCSVLFFSTVLPRGFAAAVAGVLLVGGTFWGLESVNWIEYELPHSRTATVAVIAAIGLLLLAGSWLSFTRGPVHVGSTLRRTAFALAIPLGVLLPAGAAGAMALDAWLTIEPGDAFIGSMVPSPDGSYLAVTARKEDQKQSRVWIVPTDGGEVAEVPGRYVRVYHDAWQLDGTLQVWALQVRKRGYGNGVDYVEEKRHVVDPATGTVLRTRSIAQVETTEGRRRRRGLVYGYVPEWWDSGLGARRKSPSGPWTKRVTWAAGDVDVELESVTPIHMSPRPGCVILSPEPGVLVHRDLSTGEDLLRIETGAKHYSGMISAGGRYFFLYESAGVESSVTRILDAATGEHVAGPFGRGAQIRMQPYHLGYPESEWVFLHYSDKDGAGESQLLNLSTGAKLEWPGGGGHWPPPVATRVPGLGTALVRDGHIEVIDAHGVVIRTLLD